MYQETLCEHCVFKTLDVSGKQNGCYLNRVEKFKTKDNGNFKIVEGFCSACRNIYWKHANNLITDEQMKNFVMEEIKMTYEIILICDNSNSREDVLVSIKNIQNLRYKPFRVNIVMDKLATHLFSTIDGLDSSFNLVIDLQNKFETIATVVNKIKAGYLVFTQPPANIASIVLEDFDRAMNIDLNPKATYFSDEFYVCPTFMYKAVMYQENPFEWINQNVTAH